MSFLNSICRSLQKIKINSLNNFYAKSLPVTQQRIRCIHMSPAASHFSSLLSTRISSSAAVRTFHTSQQQSQFDMLQKIHDSVYKKKKKKRYTFGRPFLKGVVVQTLIKKPKKPNSANRKCVKVRLGINGKEVIAYVPGEGHNLQEHSIVLLRGGRLRDVPGVKLKCVRGKYDLAPVKKPV